MKTLDRKKIIFLAIAFVVFLVIGLQVANFAFLFANKVNVKYWGETYSVFLVFKGIFGDYVFGWQALGIGLATSLVLFAVVTYKTLTTRSLHGEARFASEAEIKAQKLFNDDGHSIIIGKFKKKFLRFGGQQFVALGAPTRSGKGVGIVIPNLLEWQESAVVQDIKQECFDYTSRYRAEKLGNEVFLFDPFSLRSHRYNPFSYVDFDSPQIDDQLNDLALMIYPAEDGDGNSKFFNQQAQNLFCGLCYLYRDIALTKDGRGFCKLVGISEVELSLYGILQLSKGYKMEYDGKIETGLESLYEKMEECEILSNEARRRMSSYFQIDSDNTKSGVMASFNAPLGAFEGKTLRYTTQTSDFDLRDIRKRKMTIYIGITPDKLKNATFILNLFWSQLLDLNTKELPQTNKELKYRCLLVMDEFTAPGRILVYQKGVSFIAGYNLRSLMIYQSNSQLESPPPVGYGKEGAKTLLTNHACQIFYAPREQEDAEKISKILGNMTVKNTNKSVNYNGVGVFNSGGASQSETHRALMLPQELREMPFEKELITIDAGKPILADKAFYYNDPYFMDKLKSVSPSMAKIEKIPNRKELESAILAGECRVEIPILQGDN